MRKRKKIIIVGSLDFARWLGDMGIEGTDYRFGLSLNECEARNANIYTTEPLEPGIIMAASSIYAAVSDDDLPATRWMTYPELKKHARLEQFIALKTVDQKPKITVRQKGGRK